MINKKRGVILVTLVVFLLVSSLFALGEVRINERAGNYINLGSDDDDGGDCDSTCKVISGVSNIPEIIDDHPTGFGCYAKWCEYDKSNDNDCVKGYLPIGSHVRPFCQKEDRFSYSDFQDKTTTGSDSNDVKDAVKCKEFKTNDEKTYICASDNFWHGCTLEEDAPDGQGTLVWLKDKETGFDIVYNCTTHDTFDDIPDWEEIDIDMDHDGYTLKQGDCADNLNDSRLQPSDMCPDFEEGQTCEYPKHSKCAICINPGAPEVCGDGINNDCGGSEGYGEGVDELDGKTSDSCDNNRESCELLDGQNNIFGQPFSWLQTGVDEIGYCCGFHGVEEDLGLMLESKEGDGQYLCLNQQKELVGRENDLPSWGASELSGGEAADEAPANPGGTCVDWCWVSPIGDAKFEIFTVKKPGQPPYDVFSDSQRWHECNSNNSGELFMGNNPLVDTQIANHFYCYQEGKHWSWAECFGQGEDKHYNKNVKGRNAGESLYALYLDSAEEGQNEGEKIILGQIIKINSAKGAFDKFYETFYEKAPYFDFYGYDELNFFLKFIDDSGNVLTGDSSDLILPANVELTMYGPSSTGGEFTKYYEENILGYIVNGPYFTEDGWMHIKVPIPSNLKAVSNLELIPKPSKNKLMVKNIYLTRSGESSPVCSGEDDIERSSWLSSFDDGDITTNINGEKMCKSYYGEDAWLGDDQIVKEASRSCCGNDPFEYYAGKSATNSGCWNSQPIASGETIMDVEFKVAYKDKNVTIDYPTETVQYSVDQDRSGFSSGVGEIQFQCPDKKDFKIGDVRFKLKGDCNGQLVNSPFEMCSLRLVKKKNGLTLFIDILSVATLGIIIPFYSSGSATNGFQCGKEVLQNGQPIGFDNVIEVDSFSEMMPDPNKIYVSENFHGSYMWTEEVDEGSSITTPLSLLDSPLILDRFEIDKADYLQPGGDYSGSYKVSYQSSNNAVDLSFFDSSYGSNLGEEFDVNELNEGKSIIYLVASMNEKYNIESNIIETGHVETLHYSCAQDECLYPLPGHPPYSLKNSNPEMYELYFVKGHNPEKDEIPVGKYPKTFQDYGNVKVRKISQQIVYLNPEAGNDTEQVTDDRGFYGCQAADYIESFLPSNFTYENLPYCSIKGNLFCSPSLTHESGKEKFTTINSWSAEGIDEVGYQNPEPTEENISNFYDDLQLELRTQHFDAVERNYSAPVLPARNVISNAEFSVAGDVLPHWELITPQGTFKDDEKERTESVDSETAKKVIIKTGEILRSERIAVDKNVDFFFSANSSPTVEITLVDKDGNSELALLPKFSSKNASYLIIEFKGPGEVFQPMLQKVDEMGTTDYYYNINHIQRSAVACCPTDYCWNGYACVEPMQSLTSLAEHIEEGRDYRCVDGEWKYLPVQFDWNRQGWGFCSQPNQCFVLSSYLGASDDYDANDFYEGNYPTCINDSNYVLDHYCENGNWTSRTKFLTDKLLEVAESNEYILYCSHYQETFLNTENQEVYIAGENPYATEQTQDVGETLLGSAEPETGFACFPGLSDPEGKRLVPEDENTCINNVCILKYKEGGKFKVAFATTLNKEITSEDSFLIALDIAQDKLNEVCQATSNDSFIACDLSGTDLEGDLWYSPGPNAIIYGKEGIQISPSFFGKVVDWFKDLFGGESELSDEKKFITDAQNVRDVYFLKKGGKTVRAVQEYVGNQQTLIAEYENFQTPICDYINNIQLPPELETELLETISEMEDLSCTVDGTKQKVEMVGGLDYFWPQLTGRLRVKEE